jgi:signal transduction histidine kinase
MDYSLMTAVLRAVFPTAAPDELRYQIRIFSLVLVFMIAVGLLNILGANPVPIIREATLILTAVEIILLVLAQIGLTIRRLAWVLCSALFLVFTGAVLSSGGIQSPLLALYATVLALAMLFLTWRGAAVFSLLVGLVLFFLFVNPALAPVPAGNLHTEQRVQLYTTYYGMLVIALAAAAYHQARLLRHYQEQTQRLIEREQQLQAEIVHRFDAQRAQGRLVAVLENTSDLVSISTADGRITYINKAGQRMLGLQASDPAPWSFECFYPDWARRIVTEQGIPTATTRGVWSGETALIDSAGVEIPVSQVIIAHRDSSGQLEWFSTVVRSLAESRRAEQNRLELALQRERMDVLQQFVAEMTHDIKTPLTAINNGLYLLEHQKDSTQQQQKIDGIKLQVKLLNQLVQDILTYSRLEESGQHTLLPVDLNDLLAEAVRELQPTVESKRHTVRMESTNTPHIVMGFRDDLSRVMTNLLENALNYTPDGGIVAVRSYFTDGRVVAEFEDTGVGIEAEDIPRIFDRFYRAAAARALQSGGSGLGLAIVKKIVQTHGGTITVESNPGQGSIFRVWLPSPRATSLE